MAELAIGAVSFFFQVFAGCIQGLYISISHGDNL
jgi:hypothetical protein